MEADLHGLNFIEFHQRCRPYRDDNASKDGTGWVRNFREMRFPADLLSSVSGCAVDRAAGQQLKQCCPLK